MKVRVSCRNYTISLIARKLSNLRALLSFLYQNINQKTLQSKSLRPDSHWSPPRPLFSKVPGIKSFTQ